MRRSWATAFALKSGGTRSGTKGRRASSCTTKLTIRTSCETSRPIRNTATLLPRCSGCCAACAATDANVTNSVRAGVVVYGGPGCRSAAGCPCAFQAEHRLDLERRHEPAHRRLWRCAGANARARSARARIDPLHARVHDGACVRSEPRGDHHRHVSDGDRRAAHAHDRRSRARAAGTVPRGAAVLRESISGVSARGRLLHEQSREDRLPVRRPVHDLGRSRPRRALAQSHRTAASRSFRSSTSR